MKLNLTKRACYALTSKITVLFFSLLFTVLLNAQVINEGFEEPIWTSFTTGAGGNTSGQVIITATTAGSIMTYLTAQGTTGSTTATNTSPNSGTWWYSKACTQSSNSTKLGAGCHSVTHSIKVGTSGYIATPLTPAAIVSITFWASTTGTILAGLATDPNAGQAVYNSNTSSAVGPFSYATTTYPGGNGSMTSYSYAGTFSGPCRFAIFNPGGGGSIYIDDIMVYLPSGTPPTVVTNSASPIGITNAQVNATVTPGTLPLLASGIIWSTSALTGTVADTLLPKTRNTPSAVAAFSDMATPLLANTLYHTEAYVIGLDGSFNPGNIISFTTKPASTPVLTTNTPNSVTSYKAISGGVIVDDGGSAITQKGIVYDVNPNPSYPITTVAGVSGSVLGSPTFNGSAPYGNCVMNNLKPNTKYYVRAYAKNQSGIAHGNLDFFTTAPPVPALIATPIQMDFGDIVFGSTSTPLSYTLTCYNIPAGSGAISISFPAPYQLSLAPNGGFTATSPFIVPYTSTGATFKKTIYVKLPSTNYGSFCGNIIQTTAAVVAPNADTVKVCGNVITSPAQLSNMGTDFWVGHGYEQKMASKIGTTPTYGLLLYIATGAQSANVTVSMPLLGGGFTPLSYTIPPNSVQIVSGFPTGDPNDAKNASGLPDARLYYTGVSNRGIHVTSDNGVPVALFLYDYATNSSAGGAMVFPSNTWNSSYIVQAFGGMNSNTGPPSSFFFVIANEDNTVVSFRPTTNVIDSVSSPVIAGGDGGNGIKFAAGTSYNVTLNKGQVFNAMGDASTGVGLDLSGTIVSTPCDKKIAVFAGNGRTLIKTLNAPAGAPGGCNNPPDGSDNLLQQMFPKVAWGTYYLTVPTKSMEYNVFRVTVSDPTTKVWVNIPATTAHNAGNALTANWNATGLYYEIEGNDLKKIESDKPINVTQFIVTGACSSKGGASVIGNNGQGDPEMIMLSPVQQAINAATVYTSDFKNGKSGGTYLNVIIPKAGVGSFRLDSISNPTQKVDTGQSSYTANFYGVAPLIPIANAFKPHPQDTNYYWAKFHVSYPAVHTLSSAIPFNAIAYGTADGESWGYNAGTAINNLSSIKVAQNPHGTDTSTSSIHTCKDNLVTLQIAFPYPPATVDSIVWNSGVDPRISPDTMFTGPRILDPGGSGNMYADTSGYIDRDGIRFYIYTCTVPFKFSEFGTYPITATAMGKFSSDCGGLDEQKIYVVVGSDNINYSVSVGSCGSNTVTFIDNTTPLPTTTISQWNWNYGDGNTTTANTNANQVHPYAAGSTGFMTHLQTINSIGCTSEDSLYVDLSGGFNTSFYVDKDTICPGKTITFTSTSTTGGTNGTINTWYWDFGDGAGPQPFATNTATHTFTTTATVIHTVKTNAGCTSPVTADTVIVVKPKPKADFIPPAGVCLPGSTLFINNTDTAVSGACTYYWNFGDGIGTSTIKDPSYAYNIPVPAAGYTIKLVSTSSFGCVSDTVSKTITNIYDKPTASFTITKDSVCLGTAANFTGSFTGLNQTAASWHWFMGDTKDTVTIASALSYTYAAIGSYHIQMIAVSDKGCVSDTFPVSPAVKTVVVNPIPVAHFILPGSCLSSGSVTFLDSSYVVPADVNPFTYSWSFGSVAKDGINTYNAPGTYPVTHTVTTSAGCTNSETLNYTVAGTKPKPYFTVLNETNLCSNIDVQINDTSRNDIGAIKTIQILWDITDATSLQTDNAPTTGGAGTSHIYTHTYPKLGVTKTYTIRLIAYSGPGCGDSTADYQITVYGSPKVVFNSTPQKGICAEATPRNLSTVAGETNGLAGSWTYSGTGISGSTFDPAISGVGTYNIQALFITNTPAIGCRDSAQSPITVWATPTVAYKISDTTCEKQTVNFNDLSVAGAGSGNIKTWLWTFGEPFPAFTKNTTHKFSTNGAFIISLKVTTDSGCTAKHDSIITVHPLPKIGFRLPTAICLPAGVSQFIDTSSIADGSEAQFRYLWNFDDIPTGVNNTATIANPTHVFSSPGSFNIKLQITSKDNCVNIDSTLLPASLIHPQPKAGFKTSVAEVCLGGAPILFTDTSKGLVKTYYWDFYGDQSAMGSGKKTTYQYTIAGLFDAMHYIDDNFGCRSDTAHAIITIDSLPVVRGGGIKYIVSGTSEVLTPYVSGADTVMWSPLTYLTDYITASPTCTPKKDISYLLTARSLEGCLSSDSVRVSILQVPVIPNAFSPNGDGVNDTWDITYLNLYEGASVQVFNRYGQMVYTSLGYPTPWKGNMLNTGDALPVGVYYYIIKAGNKIPQLTGSLTIVR